MNAPSVDRPPLRSLLRDNDSIADIVGTTENMGERLVSNFFVRKKALIWGVSVKGVKLTIHKHPGFLGLAGRKVSNCCVYLQEEGRVF
jgi:hypothetical protein